MPLLSSDDSDDSKGNINPIQIDEQFKKIEKEILLGTFSIYKFFRNLAYWILSHILGPILCIILDLYKGKKNEICFNAI